MFLVLSFLDMGYKQELGWRWKLNIWQVAMWREGKPHSRIWDMRNYEKKSLIYIDMILGVLPPLDESWDGKEVQNIQRTTW